MVKKRADLDQILSQVSKDCKQSKKSMYITLKKNIDFTSFKNKDKKLQIKEKEQQLAQNPDTVSDVLLKFKGQDTKQSSLINNENQIIYIKQLLNVFRLDLNLKKNEKITKKIKKTSLKVPNSKSSLRQTERNKRYRERRQKQKEIKLQNKKKLIQESKIKK